MLMPEVSRYMTHEPYIIPPTATAATAREVMQHHQIRHLPILDGAQLVGLVAAADVDAIAADQLDNILVSSVMTKPLTVWGAMPLDEVAETMAAKQAECVVVLGGHGVQGIFTATDALRALSAVLQRTAG